MDLQIELAKLLPGGRLNWQRLQWQQSNIELQLLAAESALLSLDVQQIGEYWQQLPYWAFAWSSGRALAKYILDNPEIVKDKNIADFGAGSGIVAIAALKAGAKSAVAVDIDPQALLATMLNAAKNDVSLKVVKEIPEEGIDLLVVGDVLYDPKKSRLGSAAICPRDAADMG